MVSWQSPPFIYDTGPVIDATAATAALPRLAGSPCHAVGQLADTFLDVVVQALDMAKA